MTTRRRWEDEDVVEWAHYFVDLGFTMDELEILIEVPHSTMSWCFINRLPHIDPVLGQRVESLTRAHEHSSRGKTGRRKKC